MSFESLKVDELKTVAESFGVDLTDIKNKAEIIAALTEEGVSYDMYAKFSNSEKEEIEPEPEAKSKAQMKKELKGNTVLIKMERLNPSYETYGFLFTQTHPFVVVPESIAQEIFDNEEGFRMATPREAQEFYS